MLTLSAAQVAILADASLEDFEGRTMRSLHELLDADYTLPSDEEFRELIRRGINVAGQYEIYSEQDVYLFVMLMCVLGTSFDVDPNLPWAHAILSDTQTDGGERIQLLMDAASDGQSDDAENVPIGDPT